MNIHVAFAHIDGTPDNANFTCVKATRKMFEAGRTVINFRGGAAVHVETGRAVVAAHFAHASTIYVYED